MLPSVILSILYNLGFLRINPVRCHAPGNLATSGVRQAPVAHRIRGQAGFGRQTLAWGS